MKRAMIPALSVIVLLALASCQTVQGSLPTAMVGGQKVFFEKGLPATASTEGLALIEIKDGLGFSLSGLDGVSYWSDWDGGFHGLLYVNPGKRNVVVHVQFSDENGNIWVGKPHQIMDLAAGQKYVLAIKPNIGTGDAEVLYTPAK